MDEKSGNSVREVFLEAAEMEDPETRAAYLDKACAGDDSLRRRVEAILAAEAQAGGPPAEAPSSAQTSSDPALGSRVGHYKLLQQIGEGGCGVVFMAEQEQPVRRKVALKVIKLGMDTRQVVARFEAERQALAMMDHPNIAKVLDAGTTESVVQERDGRARHSVRADTQDSEGGAQGTDAPYPPRAVLSAGRPYFVMELVRGIKITEYCDQHQFSTRQRLDLFIQVCQAVQHAHQKGIIHRDLKPSNILVTELDGVPLPKIIDFGIAKAVEGRLTDQTLFTAFEQFIGTPAYMSPEQAAMTALDVDTRSDIYSLGVLLYELLTGKTPFDTKALLSSGLDAMRQTIREVTPVRPSTRLRQTGVTSSPGSSPTHRLAPLATDLDWIVMKCLEKDRKRRYETANGLAMDLKRHLENEPVLARQPSRLYEFQKSVQRHKVGFTATTAIIVVLSAGVLMSTWQALRATNAKRDALNARQQAQAAELVARQRAYASDMNLAKQALDEGNFGGAIELLNRQRPKPGQKDLRGWEWRYLWGQTRSDALFTLCQLKAEVNSLAASPDGHWLAVGANHEGGVEVWNLQTRQAVTNLAKDEELVRAAFSPTDPLLAFAGTRAPASQHPQTTLHLWNTASRQMVTNWPLDRVCMGLAFSKDGRTLVTSTAYGHITLWRMPDGTLLTNYPSKQMRNIGTEFAATPDLSLAAYAMGSWIRVVDLRHGTNLWAKKAATYKRISALAFSRDGKTLASAGFGESDIRLWDVATAKELGSLKGHTSWVSSLVFWPDGKKLASGSGDQTIRIWDLATRKCLDVLRGHRDEVWRLALLPDNNTLVSGGKDGTVCFWDTATNHPRSRSVTIPPTIWHWCFAADSQSVLTVNRQGQVTRWSGSDFQREEPVFSLPAEGNVRRAAVSMDDRFLAVGLTNGTVQVWDVTRKALWRQLTNSAGPIVPLGFLRDGKELLTADPSLHLFLRWDLKTGLETHVRTVRWELQTGGVSPDGQLGVGVSRDRGVAVHLSEPSSSIRLLDIQEGSCVVFSPDGKRVAASSDLGYVRVWDTATWREEATLRGFLHAARSAAFSPDGKRLAAGGASSHKRVILWDTDSWQAVLTLGGQGPDLKINGTGFSPDGNILAAGNELGAVVLWRAPSWAEIRAKEKAKQKAVHPPQANAP